MVDIQTLKHILRQRYITMDEDDFNIHLSQMNRLFSTEITVEDLLYHQAQPQFQIQI